MESNSDVIVKSGFLKKRSKYLKIWKKRFIVLTSKNIFAFTSEDKDADCTMNILLNSCGRVESSDKILDKQFTFSVEDEENRLVYYFQAESEEDKNEWMRRIQLEISNLKNEKEVVNFDNIHN